MSTSSIQADSLVRPSTCISIVLCTYNGEKFLPDLLDSLLKQTLLPTELVWRDDRSTDSTSQIAADFIRRAPFPVDFSVNPENLGPMQNFGHAMSGATGSHIALCDQDDVWLPEKLEQIIQYFSEPETKLVYSNSLLLDSDRGLSEQTFLEQRGTQHPNKDTLSYLLFQNTVSGCMSMFTSDLLPLALPVPDAAIMHDWWITLVASAVGRVKHIPAVTTLYRQHSDNVIGAPERFTLASLRQSGVPFGLWHRAGRKFEISANQAIALQNRFKEQQMEPPGSLTEFTAHLGKSRVDLFRSCQKLDIQRGDWIRNLYFVLGLLAYRPAKLIETE